MRRLLRRVVGETFSEMLGWTRPDIPAYLADLLVRFSHVQNVFRISDAAGRALDDVGEMLLEADPRLRAASFEREREVRRHIGDFVLFHLGLFPEYVRAHATTRVPDLYVDWVRTGAESYRIVAAFDYGPYAGEAALFRAMADRYSQCVAGLSEVGRRLRRLGVRPGKPGAGPPGGVS